MKHHQQQILIIITMKAQQMPIPTTPLITHQRNLQVQQRNHIIQYTSTILIHFISRYRIQTTATTRLATNTHTKKRMAIIHTHRSHLSSTGSRILHYCSKCQGENT